MVVHCIILFVLSAAEILLDDFLITENSPFQSDVNTPVLTSERASNVASPRTNNLSPFDPISSDDGSQSPSSGGLRLGLFFFLLLVPTLFSF